MGSEGNSPQQPPEGSAPWRAAAAGGGGGITAAVLQDHALAWAVLAAFTLWLAHDLVIAWITRNSTRSKNGPGSAGRAGRGTSPRRPATFNAKQGTSRTHIEDLFELQHERASVLGHGDEHRVRGCGAGRA
jgi:hypothetical protein